MKRIWQSYRDACYLVSDALFNGLIKLFDRME